jgi:thiaminase/transcriptional activator TenA
MKLFERLKADCSAEWNSYACHEFVERMGEGTLDKKSFQHYLIQDYLFLIQFARAHALAVYKARNLEEMRGALEGLKAILDTEMQLHLKLCAQWGLSPDEVEATPEAQATIAYTRYVLEAGQAGDILDLFVALAPCMIGYAEIGARLAALPNGQSDDNPYTVWISEYASDEYQEIAQGTRDLLDKLAETSFTEARYPRLLELFRQATKLEADFWTMGMTLAD